MGLKEFQGKARHDHGNRNKKPIVKKSVNNPTSGLLIYRGLSPIQSGFYGCQRIAATTL
jgi:hypothetical protein